VRFDPLPPSHPAAGNGRKPCVGRRSRRVPGSEALADEGFVRPWRMTRSETVAGGRFVPQRGRGDVPGCGFRVASRDSWSSAGCRRVLPGAAGCWGRKLSLARGSGRVARCRGQKLSRAEGSCRAAGFVLRRGLASLAPLANLSIPRPDSRPGPAPRSPTPSAVRRPDRRARQRRRTPRRAAAARRTRSTLGPGSRRSGGR